MSEKTHYTCHCGWWHPLGVECTNEKKMTETRTCSRCGTDFEVVRHPIVMCGRCECDDRNRERRADQKAQPGSLHPDGCAARWSVKPIFAWYDLWAGIYWDSRKRKLYILPFPCVGLVIEFPMRHND